MSGRRQRSRAKPLQVSDWTIADRLCAGSRDGALQARVAEADRVVRALVGRRRIVGAQFGAVGYGVGAEFGDAGFELRYVLREEVVRVAGPLEDEAVGAEDAAFCAAVRLSSPLISKLKLLCSPSSRRTGRR